MVGRNYLETCTQNLVEKIMCPTKKCHKFGGESLVFWTNPSPLVLTKFNFLLVKISRVARYIIMKLNKTSTFMFARDTMVNPVWWLESQCLVVKSQYLVVKLPISGNKVLKSCGSTAKFWFKSNHNHPFLAHGPPGPLPSPCPLLPHEESVQLPAVSFCSAPISQGGAAHLELFLHEDFRQAMYMHI